MTSPPERPWAGTSWETIEIAGPPWWRRQLTRGVVVLFALALLAPIPVIVWVIFQGHEGREAIRTHFDRIGLGALTPGECVDEVGEAEYQTLRPVPCASPHDGEITGVVALTGPGYPGKEQVIEESEGLCVRATESWILDGPGADTDLAMGFFYPTLASWEPDRPTTTCYAVASSGNKLRGPLGAIR